MSDTRIPSQVGGSNSNNNRTRSRSPISRPTTPLRTSSRSSFRNSHGPSTAAHGVAGGRDGGHARGGSTSTSSHLAALDTLEPQFAELSDSMADLEANFMHLQLMHESLSRFGENFASFLYGLNMNAFVVDFPEQPLAESIRRWQKQQRQRQREAAGFSAGDTSTIILPNSGSATSTSNTAADTTYMTSDTSFASMKATPRRRTMGGVPPTPRTNSTVTSTGASTTGAGSTKRSGIPSASRGSTTSRAGSRGATRAGRASALPRGRGTGTGSSRGTR